MNYGTKAVIGNRLDSRGQRLNIPKSLTLVCLTDATDHRGVLNRNSRLDRGYPARYGEAFTNAQLDSMVSSVPEVDLGHRGTYVLSRNNEMKLPKRSPYSQRGISVVREITYIKKA